MSKINLPKNLLLIYLLNIYSFCRDELLHLNDLAKHMKTITTASDLSKVETIVDVLSRMDDDRDGAVKVEHVLHVLDLLGEDQVRIYLLTCTFLFY